MGSELNGRKQHHYDISKSRRTRRSSVATAAPPDQHHTTDGSKMVEEAAADKLTAAPPDQHHTTDGSKMVEAAADKLDVGKEEEEENGRRSLKELMGGDGANNTSDVKEKSKSSCGEELKQDEKINLAVVVRQGDGMEKGKMKGMVGRYMKILNHLIKAKRDAHKGQKKANVRLLM